MPRGLIRSVLTVYLFALTNQHIGCVTSLTGRSPSLSLSLSLSSSLSVCLSVSTIVCVPVYLCVCVVASHRNSGALDKIWRRTPFLSFPTLPSLHSSSLPFPLLLLPSFFLRFPFPFSFPSPYPSRAVPFLKSRTSEIQLDGLRERCAPPARSGAEG